MNENDRIATESLALHHAEAVHAECGPTGYAGARGRGRRVLIVEDDALQALDLELTLLAAGYDVVGSAADAASGLEMVERLRPDVAALDYRLRDGTSAPVARALARAGCHYVYVTASREEAAADASLPVAPMLAKPVDPQAMVSALAA